VLISELGGPNSRPSINIQDRRHRWEVTELDKVRRQWSNARGGAGDLTETQSIDSYICCQ
jgi:hypothetical protein